MKGRTGTTSYCNFCAMHNHGLCVGECACGARGHDPDVETAAAMRRYEAPDSAKLPTEELATQWRRKDSGTAALAQTVRSVASAPRIVQMARRRYAFGPASGPVVDAIVEQPTDDCLAARRSAAARKAAATRKARQLAAVTA